MSAEYSVDEVRNSARLLDGLSRKMLNDYAERIEADESAVPVGYVNERDLTFLHASGHPAGPRECRIASEPFGNMKAPLSTYPPAQAAQVDATYPFESALRELIESVDPTIESGDIFADAHTAAMAIQARTTPKDFLTNGTRVIWESSNGTEFPATITGWHPATYDAVLDDGCDAKGFVRKRFKRTDTAESVAQAGRNAIRCPDCGSTDSASCAAACGWATHPHSPDAADSGRVTDKVLRIAQDAWNGCEQRSMRIYPSDWPGLRAAITAALAAQGQGVSHD